MRRTLLDESHLAFADAVAAFVAKEVTPHYEAWEAAGIIDREVWRAAGKAGLLGLSVPEEYGGGGNTDYRYNAVLCEAMEGTPGLALSLHSEVVGPYLLELCTEEQRQRWLPGFCTGDLVTAIAMTEPGAGSDLQGIKTTAVQDGSGDGADWIINGSKTFITNGIHSDLVIVVAKTDKAAKHKGISLFMVERGMPGFERGRNLDKIGLHAQDTAEMSFTDVRVPAANIVGELNRGFYHLMHNLPQERLVIAIGAVARAERIFASTLDYIKTRTAFGQPIGSFQNSRFVAAEIATELDIARVYVDRCIADHTEKKLTAADAAKAKWWTTELSRSIIDRCLQLHGGYGFMEEYPVARAWRDSRVSTLYGGTTEIMKEIVGRDLGL
ncbi:MAG TPA: acyl-CoA dehydrogenase family protein [Sporichthya sp.]|nr:acyl-CoA dehydrogenase family protein [Sporichthya sp.]